MFASLGCFILGYAAADSHVLRLWCADTALTAVLFFCFGYLLKEHLHVLENLKIHYAVILAGSYLMLCMIGSRIDPLPSLNFHTIEYGNLPFSLLMMAAGLPAAVLLSIHLEHFSWLAPVKFIGRNTIVIYMLSSPAVSVFRKMFDLVGINIHSSILAAFATAGMTCIGLAIISEICGRYVPWTVGAHKPSGTGRTAQNEIEIKARV